MKRAQRLTMVQQAIEDLERRRAEQLACSEQRLNECEKRLAELESYRTNYRREFARRACQGIGMVSLTNYQTFLAQLSEAVRQQTHAVFLSRAERDSERQSWQTAAQRTQAMSRMLKRWQVDEQPEAAEPGKAPLQAPDLTRGCALLHA